MQDFIDSYVLDNQGISKDIFDHPVLIFEDHIAHHALSLDLHKDFSNLYSQDKWNLRREDNRC